MSRSVPVRPKFVVPLGPISFSWAMSSPLVGRTTPEQAVPAALSAQSNQLRVSLCTPGAYLSAKPPVSRS